MALASDEKFRCKIQPKPCTAIASPSADNAPYCAASNFLTASLFFYAIISSKIALAAKKV